MKVTTPKMAERIAARFTKFNHKSIARVLPMIQGADEGHGPGDFDSDDITYPAEITVEVEAFNTFGQKDESDRGNALEILRDRFEKISGRPATVTGVGSGSDGRIFEIANQ